MHVVATAAHFWEAMHPPPVLRVYPPLCGWFPWPALRTPDVYVGGRPMALLVLIYHVAFAGLCIVAPAMSLFDVTPAGSIACVWRGSCYARVVPDACLRHELRCNHV
jgi:hypothetical protein